MKKNAFTLMEVLLAMAIIGIIAGSVANQIKKVSADKIKLTFKNNYNHMVSTVDAIASDENVLPAVFYTDLDRTTGKKAKVSFCNATQSLDASGNSVLDFAIFPRAFMERTGNIVTSSSIGNKSNMTSSPGFRFTTKNGSYWVVRKNPLSMVCHVNDVDNADQADYVIIFDIDGLDQGTNCPYTGENLNEVTVEESDCSNPDTFKFGTTINNKVVPDRNTYYDGYTLKDFLKTNNYLKDKF